MNRTIRTLAMSALLYAGATGVANALTVNYTGKVTSVQGFSFDLQALIPVDTALAITMTLDSTVPDFLAGDPQAGIFFSALTHMAVSIPTSNLKFKSGPGGNVQTFNDVATGLNGELTDQVFFVGGQMLAGSDSLLGQVVDGIEVDFSSAQTLPPDLPGLIENDAIPTRPLASINSFLRVRTGTDASFIYFTAEGSIVPPTAVASPSTWACLALSLIPLLAYGGRNVMMLRGYSRQIPAFS